MIAVVADQIGDGRAGYGSREDVRVRGQERGVEAAPGVAYDADLLFIDHAFFEHLLYRRGDAVGYGEAGVASLKDDVGLQQKVAVRGEGAGAVVSALRWRVVMMQAVRKFLVHIDDHRVLLAGLVSGGIKERALKTGAMRVLIIDQFGAPPGVLGLKGVRIGDTLGIF